MTAAEKRHLDKVDELSEVKCSIDGCEGKAKVLSLCAKHYTRLWRTGDPLKTKSGIFHDLKETFINKTKRNENGCLVWTGFKKNGYGVVGNEGKLKQAHRAMWELVNGKIPNGLQLNHKCHNRACVEPTHLYVGTQKENMADMDNAGRRRHAKKLTEDAVKEIRYGTTSLSVLAKKYNVSYENVRWIRKGNGWKNV